MNLTIAYLSQEETYDCSHAIQLVNELREPKPGDVLMNGSVVLAVKKPNNQGKMVVLCAWQQRYVVWTYTVKTGMCQFGAYFSSIEEAMKDFRQLVSAFNKK